MATMSPDGPACRLAALPAVFWLRTDESRAAAPSERRQRSALEVETAERIMDQPPETGVDRESRSSTVSPTFFENRRDCGERKLFAWLASVLAEAVAGLAAMSGLLGRFACGEVERACSVLTMPELSSAPPSGC